MQLERWEKMRGWRGNYEGVSVAGILRQRDEAHQRGG